jgi:hypothetical protein
VYIGAADGLEKVLLSENDSDLTATVSRAVVQEKLWLRGCSLIDMFKPFFLLLLIGLLFTGCATVPTDYPRSESTAFEDYLDTTGGQLFEAAAVQHPGKSGFAIIRYGRPAFTARVALTELAERSLDVQYYIWEADATGWILAERMIF